MVGKRLAPLVLALMVVALVLFSSEAMDRIAECYASRRENALDERRRALKACLDGLPEDSRRLVTERYSGDSSLKKLAASRGTSESALKMRLLRLRKRLALCVRTRLSGRLAPQGAEDSRESS